MSGDALAACPLCGHRFREGAPVCGGCPLAGGCDAVCCPRCGYRFVTGSRLVAALERLLRRALPGREEATP